MSGPGSSAQNGAPPLQIPGRGNPPPSPPISVSRSSTGGGPNQDSRGRQSSGGPQGSGQSGSRDGARKYDPRALEAQLAQHHRVLKEYLAPQLRDDKGYLPHNRARDKLLRLSPVQFQELSTDVYDELLRREDERQNPAPSGSSPSVPRFLLPRNNFHPKRNQARQKLSTLPGKKFRELATDVLFELERRFPRFGGNDPIARPQSRSTSQSRPGTRNGFPTAQLANRRPSNASSGAAPYSPGVIDDSRSDITKPPPGAKRFQNGEIVPNKSTMVEDDDDDDDEDEDPYDLEKTGARASRRTTNRSLPFSINNEDKETINALEAKVDELQSQVSLKEQDAVKTQGLKDNLEKQLQSAESLNASLQSEIDRLKTDRTKDDWRSRYENLQKEMRDQRQATDEVRRAAQDSLQEMRVMTERWGTSSSEHSRDSANNVEALQQQVADLQASVDRWRSRHADAKAHLRTLRASSTGLFLANPTAPQFVHQAGLLDQRGAIRDTSVTRFQDAIDELLHVARQGPPDTYTNGSHNSSQSNGSSNGSTSAQIMPTVRRLVACVRAVNSDVAQAGSRNGLPADQAAQRAKLEQRIAAATNHVITVARAHAGSEGLAPVVLLDAATGHLVEAIVALAKIVRVRPTPEGELEATEGEDGSEDEFR